MRLGVSAESRGLEQLPHTTDQRAVPRRARRCRQWLWRGWRNHLSAPTAKAGDPPVELRDTHHDHWDLPVRGRDARDPLETRTGRRVPRRANREPPGQYGAERLTCGTTKSDPGGREPRPRERGRPLLLDSAQRMLAG